MRERLDPRPLIGWNELVDLPDWGVRNLRAKVDTGARTSALHVDRLHEVGRHRVGFDVVLHRQRRDRRIHVIAPVVRIGRVRSSTGHFTERYFVETTLRLGPVVKRIEVSLVDREKMAFRMLLGRTALTGFVIDPAHRQLGARRTVRKRTKR